MILSPSVSSFLLLVFFWMKREKGTVVYVGKKGKSYLCRSSSLSISLSDEWSEHSHYNIFFLFLIVYRHRSPKDVNRLSPSLVTIARDVFQSTRKSRRRRRKNLGREQDRKIAFRPLCAPHRRDEHVNLNMWYKASTD